MTMTWSEMRIYLDREFFDKIKARDEKKMKLILAEYLMVQFSVHPLSVIPVDFIITYSFFPTRDNGFKRHASNFVGTGRFSRKGKAWVIWISFTPHYDTCPYAVSVIKTCALASAVTIIICASLVLRSKLGWDTDCSNICHKRFLSFCRWIPWLYLGIWAIGRRHHHHNHHQSLKVHLTF